MLDDRHRGLRALRHQVVGGVRVEQVDVGQPLAVVLLEAADALDGRAHGVERVERPALVRVLAVAQLVDARQARRQLLRQQVVLAAQVLGDRGVVVRDVREGLGRQRAPRPGVEPARTQRLEDHVVVRGVDHRDHPGVVLGRRADHRRAADVDLLERLGEADVGAADGLDEGVEVHRDEVDRLDAVRRQLGRVVLAVAAGEQAAVHLRVQRLHAALEHLGAAGQRRDALDGYARLGDDGLRAAGREQLPAEAVQALRQLGDAGLVVGAQDRAHRVSPSLLR